MQSGVDSSRQGVNGLGKVLNVDLIRKKEEKAFSGDRWTTLSPRFWILRQLRCALNSSTTAESVTDWPYVTCGSIEVFPLSHLVNHREKNTVEHYGWLTSFQNSNCLIKALLVDVWERIQVCSLKVTDLQLPNIFPFFLVLSLVEWLAKCNITIMCCGKIS